MSSVVLATNLVFHSRIKYVGFDIHFVRDEVLAKEFLVQHIPSHKQLTEILTRPLSIQQFKWNRPKLSVIQLPLSLRGG